MTQAQKPFRGGRVFTDDDAAQQDQPQRVRYPCFAAGCPAAGTLFPNGTQSPGVCVWHYQVQPSDIPKVTQRLVDWRCVGVELEAARSLLTGEAAADARAQDEAQAQAWQRLGPVVQRSGWGDVLAPRPGEHYGEWAKHLERFIGARVVEVLSIRRSDR